VVVLISRAELYGVEVCPQNIFKLKPIPLLLCSVGCWRIALTGVKAIAEQKTTLLDFNMAHFHSLAFPPGPAAVVSRANYQEQAQPNQVAGKT